MVARILSIILRRPLPHKNVENNAIMHAEPDIFGWTITVKPEFWAPAVWAESEGMALRYKGRTYIVSYVNLSTRTLRLTNA